MTSETEHHTLASQKAGATRETWHTMQLPTAPDGRSISCLHVLKGVCCVEPRCPRQPLPVTSMVIACDPVVIPCDPAVKARHVTAEDTSLLRSLEKPLCAHPCPTWLPFLMYIKCMGIAALCAVVVQGERLGVWRRRRGQQC